jgi:hypothetical protein
MGLEMWLNWLSLHLFLKGSLKNKTGCALKAQLYGTAERSQLPISD